MPPGKYGMQEEWEREGNHEIMMDFLLPTGIFLKFPVSCNDTIKSIKKVCPFTHPQNLISDIRKTLIAYFPPAYISTIR